MAGYGTFQVEVDLSINGVWTDISPYVMQNQNIVITRGHPDWSTTTNTGSLQVQLNNTDGRFSPKNATGPYYPYLQRNTPVRVSINSGASFRFFGECSSFDSLPADPSAKVVFCTLTAGGVLRRLGKSTSNLKSAMTRYWQKLGTNAPVAYWPCEDPVGSTKLASGLGSGLPLNISNHVSLLANSSPFACAAALPVVNRAQWSSAIGAYPAGNDISVTLLFSSIAAGDNNIANVISFFSTGTIPYVELSYITGQGFLLTGLDPSGTGPNFFQSADSGNIDGTPVAVRFGLQKSGANVVWHLQVLAPGNVETSQSGTVTTATVGAASRVIVNDNFNGALLNTSSVGQIAVQNTWADLATDLASPLNAWIAETAGNRFSRLCGEESIAFLSAGTLTSSSAMGAQSQQPLTSLLQECVDADQGMMTETRTQLGLKYRTRYSLQNQSPVATLSYSSAQLGQALEPVDDDQYLTNDVTVAPSAGGAGYRITLATGALSTQAPPSGVGPYPTSVTLNLQSDSQSRDMAGWLLHLGTVNEPHYPAVGVELSRSEVSGLLSNIQSVDLGDYVTVTSPPGWLPPDPVKMIVYQVQEAIGAFTYAITWTGVPESAYETMIVADAVYGRCDTDNSVTGASSNTTVTQVQVNTAAGFNYPVWTTAAGDFPFDIGVAGERMTVTDIAGPPVNFLTGDNSAFDSTLGNWTANTNCAIAQTSAQAHSGAGSMQLTSSAAGNMNAASCTAGNILTQGLACAANDVITLSAWFKSAVSARTCDIQCQFYTSGAVSISTLTIGTTVTDGTGSWVKAAGTVVAPATSAFCRMITRVQATGGASEVHYVDDAYMADQTTGTANQQTFRVTRSVNGVVKSHSPGETVGLFFPAWVSV